MPARKPKPGESFGDLYPEIAKEWHPTKNGLLTPFDFTPGSNKKFWWKCDKGVDHIWKAQVNKRSGGAGCHICSGWKVVPSVSLVTTHPEIASEWHPTKNKDLTPNDVLFGSHKKVWWKCDKGEDHEWESLIYSRINSGCPVCSNKKVVLSNCLATTHPEIASEWHPTKNKELSPYDIVSGSNKKVWWKCDKGEDHEWLTAVQNRQNGTKCPVCEHRKLTLSNCLSTTHPKIAKQWHPTKNGLSTPFDFFSGSHKKVWWKCDKGEDHEWLAVINSRANQSSGCPVCSNKKVVKSNSLATLNPNLAKEWHPTKNGDLTPEDVSIGSEKKVWWICDEADDHVYDMAVFYKAGKRKQGCPMCNGNRIVRSNSLATTHPKIAKQWHPTKNGDLTPEDVISGSKKKVWWKCDKGEDHEWKAKLENRRQGHGCPICSGMKVVKSNSLATLNTNLAKEWHPKKNGDLKPEDVVLFTHKKVWWKCDKGEDHEWKVSVSHRSRGNNCPFCTLTPQSREELIITHELITIFKGINPKGFKTRVNGKLRSIDIYIPDLKLGIEFDGSYWHKDKRALDKLKTEELEAEGFNIIRVRQKPLKRIFEDDVMAEKKYDGKKITNDILIQIMKDYKLGKSTILKISKYIKMPNLQNEKGLEKYIDMILTEKANKTNTL